MHVSLQVNRIALPGWAANLWSLAGLTIIFRPRSGWRPPGLDVDLVLESASTERAADGWSCVLVVGMILTCRELVVRNQREAVAAIERAGGGVSYDWEWQ